MKIKQQFFAVVMAAFLSGCGVEEVAGEGNSASPTPGISPSFTPANAVINSWYSLPPKGSMSTEWHQLGVSKIAEVTEDSFPKAEEVLAKQQFVPLTRDQSKFYTGVNMPQSSKETPYLIRSVYINKETGLFEVLYKNSQVWIIHSSLGNSELAMQRGALVVLLPFSPSKVFIECSVDE